MAQKKKEWYPPQDPRESRENYSTPGLDNVFAHLSLCTVWPCNVFALFLCLLKDPYSVSTPSVGSGLSPDSSAVSPPGIAGRPQESEVQSNPGIKGEVQSNWASPSSNRKSGAALRSLVLPGVH